MEKDFAEEKLNKILKKIARNMCSKKDIRPNLSVVCFKDNKILATDACKGIILEYKDRIFDDKYVQASDIIEGQYSINDMPSVDVTFPDMELFFSNFINSEIAFDVDYMIKLLGVYKSANIEKVKINPNNGADVIELYGENSEIKIKGVLAPMK